MNESDYSGHDGLQVVPSTQSIQQEEGGMHHVPYSDKQVIPIERGLHLKGAFEKDNEKFKYLPPEEPKFDDPWWKKFAILSRHSLILSGVVLLVLIIAAAVGGSVGAYFAKQQKESAQAGASSTTASNGSRSNATQTSVTQISSISSTPGTSTSLSGTSTGTATSSSATSTSTSGWGAYNCPGDNNTIYTSPSYALKFRIFCDVDWPNGDPGINGGTITDLNYGIIAKSIDECIDQCAANKSSGGLCTAVKYGANITRSLSRPGITGNCFMKNQRGAQNNVDTIGYAEAAYLLSS